MTQGRRGTKGAREREREREREASQVSTCANEVRREKRTWNSRGNTDRPPSAHTRRSRLCSYSTGGEPDFDDDDELNEGCKRNRRMDSKPRQTRAQTSISSKTLLHNPQPSPFLLLSLAPPHNPHIEIRLPHTVHAALLNRHFSPSGRGTRR